MFSANETNTLDRCMISFLRPFIIRNQVPLCNREIQRALKKQTNRPLAQCLNLINVQREHGIQLNAP